MLTVVSWALAEGDGDGFGEAEEALGSGVGVGVAVAPGEAAAVTEPPLDPAEPSPDRPNSPWAAA